MRIILTTHPRRGPKGGSDGRTQNEASVKYRAAPACSTGKTPARTPDTTPKSRARSRWLYLANGLLERGALIVFRFQGRGPADENCLTRNQAGHPNIAQADVGAPFLRLHRRSLPPDLQIF